MLLPRRRPASTFRTTLLGVIGPGTAALSICTVMMDPARAQRLTRLLEPLGYFPNRRPPREVHKYQLALHDHSFGRYAEARQRALEVLTYLRSSDAHTALPERARLQLDGGVLILLGQLDACRTDAAFQRTIEDIGRVQTFTSRQTDSSARMTYHAHRGEREDYLSWRERTDRLAAEEGATWRNDVQVPRMTWSSHALCEDVLTLKRDMEQLRALASQVPTVARLRDVLSACYLCERGTPEEALDKYEPVLRAAEQEHGVRAIQHLGAYARILRKAGRASEAVRVCELALSRMSEEDSQFTCLVFGAKLELPLALCALGELARAKHLLEAQLLQAAAHDNPMMHGLLHAARAEVALLEGDAAALDAHGRAMQAWFAKTQHPALLAQGQRLLKRARGDAAPERASVDGSQTSPEPAADELDFETEAIPSHEAG